MTKNLQNLFVLLLVVFSVSVSVNAQQTPFTIFSPDRKIMVGVQLAGGVPTYTVSYLGKQVLQPSLLGVQRSDADLSKNLKLVTTTPVQTVNDEYTMVYAKKRHNSYRANRRTLKLVNASGNALDIVFQVSNDGVAFRYYFPGKSTHPVQVLKEATTFKFDTSARAWLQPMQVSKTGWEQTNPAYEEHYKQNLPVGTPSPNAAGWVFPALFRQKDTWLLLTEAAVDSNYCAGRLKAEAPGGEYTLGFPDTREVIKNGNLLPRANLPFFSPWRVIAVGGLNTIIESSLGTDVAKPATITSSWVKPGKASWSWINSKDDSLVYSEQKRYVDFAADMNWQYCLVDADWDRKIGYEKIRELSAYAATKNVSLLLWYNSAGDWNTVKYTPKNKLLTHEDRIREFALLNEMGIKGVKIDFFGGDGQSVMGYYLDILKDAADFKLMVNFHGATLPRGWQRTYPNLVTTEAVKGFEMITFNQSDADLEATHSTMLPFTRNAFDPMDFTPMNLYRIQTRVKRKTSSTFELALSVLFLSGIQHFAESPAGMTHVPETTKQFLRDLPNSWDDVKFLAGFPGEYLVVARKAGNKWYIAGINAGTSARNVPVDPAIFRSKKTTLFTDSGDESLIKQVVTTAALRQEVIIQPGGGFVMVLE